MKKIDQSSRRQFIKAGGIFIAASGLTAAAHVLAKEGFFKVVDRVAEIEKKLSIYDLAQFTPKA